MSAIHNKAIAYRPEIDGLRAVAVLPVILFHLGVDSFSGGYVGVDVFFVISGYLITSIIVKEMAQEKFSVLRFYERRARRILPALFFVLMCCLPFAWMWMLPNELEQFGESLVSVATFSSNFYFFWLKTDYFASAAEIQPLLHTWSLAVEEQYYVLFPFFIIIFWKLGEARLFWITFALAVASILLAEWGWRDEPEANFYLLPSRLWELLVGSLLAIWCAKRSANLQFKLVGSPILALLGLALIVYAVFRFNESTPFPGLCALVPVLGTALVIAFSDRHCISGKLLSSKPFLAIGLISYSAYLWHQPVLAYARLLGFEEPTAARTVVIMLGVLTVSYGTWRWVEAPFRQRGVIVNPLKKLLPVYVLALSLAGFAFTQSAGRAMVGLDEATAVYGGEGYGWEVSRVGELSSPNFRLYGDSHARQYMAALDKFSREEGFGWEAILHPACFSYPELTNLYKDKIHESCVSQLDNLRRTLASQPSHLIVAHRWSKRVVKLNGDSFGRIGEDKAAEDALLESLSTFMEIVPPRYNIILIGNVPGSGLIKQGGYLKCLRMPDPQCPKVFPKEDGELFEFNKRLKRLSQKYSHVHFIDPYEALCDESQCRVVEEPYLVYSDHAHLSTYGSQKVIDHFRKRLVRLLAKFES